MLALAGAAWLSSLNGGMTIMKRTILTSVSVLALFAAPALAQQSTVDQVGGGNDATVNQLGALGGTDSTITQIGNNNAAGVTQAGTNNKDRKSTRLNSSH